MNSTREHEAQMAACRRSAEARRRGGCHQPLPRHARAQSWRRSRDPVCPRRLPPPARRNYITVGGPDEATEYVAECGLAWRSTPGAVEWLSEITATLPANDA